MSNRISGDFNQEVVDAFRAAYAQQLASPDQDEIANNSGLPTNVIGNTSPWHDHVGLWKYPSGKGPDDDLRSAFDPSQFFSSEEEDDGESMSDEEVENLINEIMSESENEEQTEVEETL